MQTTRNVQLRLMLSGLVALMALLNGAVGALDLGELCSDYQPELSRSSDLLRLADQLRSDGNAGCNQRTQDSIIELANLAARLNTESCSMSTIELMRQFHIKNLASKEAQAELPLGLRDFAISLGFRLAQRCQRYLLEYLARDAQRVLDKTDLQEVDRLAEESKGYLKTVLAKASRRDPIALAAEVTRRAATELLGTERIAVNVARAESVLRMQRVCSRRLEPIYREMVMPVSTLAELGYTSNNGKLTKQLNNDPVVKKWAQIAVLCESVKPVVVVRASGGPQQTVLVLSEAEARQQAVSSDQGPAWPLQVEFSAKAPCQLDDLVGAAENKNFRKQVRNFADELDNYEHTRKVSMHKIKGKARKLVRRVRHRVASKRDEILADDKHRLARAINDFVENRRAHGHWPRGRTWLIGLGSLALILVAVSIVVAVVLIFMG